MASTAESVTVNPANLHGLNYDTLAAKQRSGPYPGPVIDIHTHLHDPDAARVFFETAEKFNVTHAFSMTPIEHLEAVQAAAPDRVHFNCVPSYQRREEPGTFTTRWLEGITTYWDLGARLIKFWAAPRGRDFAKQAQEAGVTDPDLPGALVLDSPIRRRGMQRAHDVGYRVWMTHIADPDTWFATKYADASFYGTKRQQYEPLERLLDQYHDVQWIGAHMGGSPEDLTFLSGLMDRHPNLHVDTSATKWMVRELSKHPGAFADFVRAYPTRVLFGTDIVAGEDNWQGPESGGEPGHGHELYASRFWAIRSLIESSHDGPSPIVDPDLHMVDPSAAEHSSPMLRGAGIDVDLLPGVYHDNAVALLERAYPGQDLLS
jgi:hypothetical protein